jgi:hypothetical protein
MILTFPPLQSGFDGGGNPPFALAQNQGLNMKPMIAIDTEKLLLTAPSIGFVLLLALLPPLSAEMQTSATRAAEADNDYQIGAVAVDEARQRFGTQFIDNARSRSYHPSNCPD